MEQAPDVWFRNKSEALWNANIHAVAEFLGSKTSNIVFVSNTTTGGSPEKLLLPQLYRRQHYRRPNCNCNLRLNCNYYNLYISSSVQATSIEYFTVLAVSANTKSNITKKIFNLSHGVILLYESLGRKLSVNRGSQNKQEQICRMF